MRAAAGVRRGVVVGVDIGRAKVPTADAIPSCAPALLTAAQPPAASRAEPVAHCRSLLGSPTSAAAPAPAPVSIATAQ